MVGIPKITELLIDDRRRQFEAGDRAALLEAIDLCARAGLAMPRWLAEAYSAAYGEWVAYGVRTLDEAFSINHKGRKLADLQERESLKAAVVVEVDRLRQVGEPTDENLFEQVGVVLNITGRRASDIYYEKPNHWRQFNRALREMPVPGWLKAVVVVELNKLCEEKTPTKKHFAEVGERVNLSAKQVQAIYRDKTE